VNPVDQELLYVGIDGGGSKCKSTIISASGHIRGVGTAGPANVVRNFEQSIASILESVSLAIEDAGLDLDCMSELIAGAGLAGVNLSHGHAAISRWKHPFKKFYIATDLYMACISAHAGKDGAVIVTGTGSCGIASVNGTITTLGGYGFATGDTSSGAWVGAQAVRHSLKSADDLAPKTRLLDAIYQHLNVDSPLAVAEILNDAPPSVFAKIAPLVFDMSEQGDDIATGIIQTGAEYINALARKLLEKKPPRFSMIGGMSERLFPWLDHDVQEKLSPAMEQPEMGAIYFAKQQYSLLCKG